MSTQKQKILKALMRGKKLTVRNMLLSPYNSNCPPRRISDIEEIYGIVVERDKVWRGNSRINIYYLSQETINKIKKEKRDVR